ncbi:MAG: beta-1,6-N-acetylglucosaminyltransferase [Pedobacter sp.]
MKKAYIIVAHKNPKQLHRLITRLSDGNSEFFVHIGLNTSISAFFEILDIGAHVRFLPRFNSAWGGYGTIEPYLSGMRAVRDSSTEFDRIMLLSGQDYPIKSNKEIDEFFKNSPYSVFLDYHPIPNYKKWPGRDRGGLYRVDKYYLGMEWHQRLRSRSLNLVSGYVPFMRRKIPNNMQPYTGQTWFNLDMYSLNYILDYHDAHPEYFKFHKHTYVADELFIQMIVGNSKDERLLNSIDKSEKRFTVWVDPTNAHPVILDKSHFPAMKTSTDLFARKFEESNTEILDLIDQEMLFK